ncbi:conjugal transfer protein [Salinactinospora qingdaonensis]|uniref:Conjugative transposon protein TcpC n=1 Tax=Salinactinospora qingdaonensis TaxID=702744 RepID=A0ABP7FKV9_9ACTN
MARKSTARRGGAPSDSASTASTADTWEGVRARRPRSGAGGRWWVWLGRALLWAFILVVIFNGIWMPLRSGFAQQPDQPSEATDAPDFPRTAAAAFTLRFAEVYLNTQDSEQQRASDLAEFLPEGQAASLATDAATLSAENIQVLKVEVKDANNAIVTLSADINGAPMSLDVPLYASHGGSALVVSGRPALISAPTKAQLPEQAGITGDSQVRRELEPILEGFFESYAETPEHLARYLESGSSINALPTGTVSFAELRKVFVPTTSEQRSADVREVRATVVWRLPSDGEDDSDDTAELVQSYLLTVVKDGSSWYVRAVQGAPNSFGT